jgi:uncharacterized SAM-binding protein YcdF (DUF218 family)
MLLVGLLFLFLAAGVFHAGNLLVLTRTLEHPDAILSLASHEWERLPATAKLARENPEALVILTLPQPATIYNCHDCGGRLERLKRLGISPERVRLIPLTSPGTYGEALAALAFARRTPIQRLVVVTSPYHTRRSLAAFRSVFDGSQVTIGIEPTIDWSPARPARWWATPYDRAYVAYEWAGTLYYALRYRVFPWS